MFFLYMTLVLLRYFFPQFGKHVIAHSAMAISVIACMHGVFLSAVVLPMMDWRPDQLGRYIYWVYKLQAFLSVNYS